MDTYAGCSSCIYMNFPRNLARDTLTTVFFFFVIKESSGMREGDDRSNGIVYFYFLSICESATRRYYKGIIYYNLVRASIFCLHSEVENTVFAPHTFSFRPRAGSPYRVGLRAGGFNLYASNNSSDIVVIIVQSIRSVLRSFKILNVERD